MERNPLSVTPPTPPSLLDIDPDSYKRLLNRTAVTITKRARKRGATYQVREAIDAIDAAFQRCDGTDPYDGLPLNNRIHDRGRSPTVSPVSSSSAATFEILSLQTKEAKGERNAEEFIAHCRAVVAHADTTSTTTR